MRFRRAIGDIVLVAGINLISIACNAQQPITLSAQQEQVGRYAKLELLIEVGREYGNPFDPCEVELNVLIASPSGGSLVLPAFYCHHYERRDFARGGKTVAWYYPRGIGSWQARFAPMETGTYTARASLKDARGEVRSAPIAFECVASSGKGFLRAGDADPRFLEFSDGSHFFAIGQNLAFVGEGQYANVPKAEAIFARLAANGANFVRIWTCCKDWALAIEADKSAWTRSWTRQSPVVSAPGGEGQSQAHKCVQIEGDSGASVRANPSHPVALRPDTQYILSGRIKADGPKAVQVQLGGNEWEIAVGTSEWQTFQKEFTTGSDEYWLGAVAFKLVGPGTAWLDALSLRESGGSAELLWEADVNRPRRGYYNPLDCFMLDQLVEAAERNGIYLMLCVMTRDLYMDSLSRVDGPAYRQATQDARKLMRYAVARWGYSSSVAAWEYFNEMDPGKPTDDFYADVGGYLAQIDIYQHLRTTSTWAPSARDCRHPQLDMAQEHHYMRPDDGDFKDEVESIIRQSTWLREHAPGKPALIGEFGLATPQWGLSAYMKQDAEGVHFHNCLWASAFAGSSGTALFWWWDQLDRQDAYRHYRPLSAFLEGVSFAQLRPVDAASSDPHVRVLGYQGDACAYLWLFHERATWWSLVADGKQPDTIQGARIDIHGLHPGRYAIEWWDTHTGKTIRTEQAVSSSDAILVIDTLSFSRDIACKVRTF